MMHNFLISHSISSSTSSLWHWCNYPNKTFSHEEYLGNNKLLSLKSLKLHHTSWMIAHHINPCFVVFSELLVDKLQIPSWPILICHAPIGSPSTIMSQTIANFPRKPWVPHPLKHFASLLVSKAPLLQCNIHHHVF